MYETHTIVDSEQSLLTKMNLHFLSGHLRRHNIHLKYQNPETKPNKIPMRFTYLFRYKSPLHRLIARKGRRSCSSGVYLRFTKYNVMSLFPSAHTNRIYLRVANGVCAIEIPLRVKENFVWWEQFVIVKIDQFVGSPELSAKVTDLNREKEGISENFWRIVDRFGSSWFATMSEISRSPQEAQVPRLAPWALGEMCHCKWICCLGETWSLTVLLVPTPKQRCNTSQTILTCIDVIEPCNH